jgi:hypothetical protein
MDQIDGINKNGGIKDNGFMVLHDSSCLNLVLHVSARFINSCPLIT